MNKDTNIRVTAGQISADLIFRTRLSIRGVHITEFVCVCVCACTKVSGSLQAAV